MSSILQMHKNNNKYGVYIYQSSIEDEVPQYKFLGNSGIRQ